MTQISAAFNRDANGNPLWTDGIVIRKTRTFDGTAGNGAQGATTIFTITGLVIAGFVSECGTDLASTTGTIELGVSGNTAGIFAQTTASTIDANEVWIDTSPANVENYAMNSIRKLITVNVIETIATADITGGTLTYYCLWNPVSSDGNVVAA